jgi:predicted amidohydrolase
VANIARAREAIRNAAEGGAALVVLPEMWCGAFIIISSHWSPYDRVGEVDAVP